MRMMLKAVVDTDAGNEVFRRGGVIEAVDRSSMSSNRKPSMSLLRMDSARSSRSSTWRTGLKSRC
jgi:hypothetical protein